ncbi:M48 family metalloprotease [Plantactinospora soyae]|uniref:Zn-dependent protease with chaperone function n=1 Tax=Plantactinospora soyae TaxID=1544732 RepID=A0A927R4D8_9ACTN|nr:M48 family metalloprotease [Plantactinospora soyae]MBE1486434.1 Zn-dependent protease with chaperone function [Plantactinospora soyae]
MTYDLVDMDRIDTCMFNAGWFGVESGRSPESLEAAFPASLAECIKPAALPWTVTMLAGAAGTLAVTALAIVLDGLWVRWRLRREGPASEATLEAARRRFAQLCAEHGPTRRPPDLWISRPGSRYTEAFTTGVPLRRPLVVVPVGLVVGGMARFDPVVHHELAHVRSRDVARASAAWWSGWISVLVMVAAVAPYAGSADSSLFSPVLKLLVPGGLAVLLLVFRAHLLRIREHAADRLAAARLDRPERLAEVLAGRRATATPHATPRIVNRVFGCHPTPAQRILLLGTGRRVDEGGFLPSLVTVLLVLLLVQPVNQMVHNSTGWRGAGDVPVYPLAGCLIAALLLPMWVHRADAARRRGVPAGWFGPVLGVGLGATAGVCLPIPGTTASSGINALSGAWIGGLLIFAVFCAMAWLMLQLAQDVDVTRRSAVALTTVAGALMAAVVLSGAIKLFFAAGNTPPAFLRATVQYIGGLSEWDAGLIFGLIALLAVMSALSGPSPRRLLARARTALRHDPIPRLALTMVVIAVVSGMLATALRLPHDRPRSTEVYLVWQRIWVFAFAGWVVLFVLLHRAAGRTAPGPRPLGTLARAFTAAALTTLAGAFVQFGLEVVVQGGWRPAHHPWLADRYTATSLLFLLILSVLLTPLAMLISPLLRRRRRPASALGRQVVAALLTVPICVAVLVGATDTLTGRPDDLTTVISAFPPTPPPRTPPPPPGGHAGRQLGQDEVATVAAAIGPALPGWTRQPAKPDQPDKPHPADRCTAPDEDGGPGPAARAEITYAAAEAKHPPVGADMMIRVDSYPEVLDPAKVFAAARAEFARCAYWSEKNADSADGRGHFRLGEHPVGPFPFPVLGSHITLTIRGEHTMIVTTAHDISAIVGHNRVHVLFTYGHAGNPPAARLKPLDERLVAALDAAVRQLGQE